MMRRPGIPAAAATIVPAAATIVLALATIVLALAALLAAPVAATAATGAWSRLPDVMRDARLTAVTTFGDGGVAVTGTRGRVAISSDGGQTWSQRSTQAAGFVGALYAAAFSDARSGLVAGAGGALLRTSDGGATWSPAAVTPGGGVLGDLHDVALSGARGYVVGDAGLVLATDDGGASWTRQPTPTGADLYGVAVTSAGLGVAGGAGGTLLTTGGDGTWALRAAGIDQSVLALAVPPVPAFGSGPPDLFAISRSSILGSDDAGATWQVPGGVPPTYTSPDDRQADAVLTGPGWSTLLVAGAGGRLTWYERGDDTLRTQWGPLDGDLVAVAGGPHTVAYAGTGDGVLERTLSAGRTPLRLSASGTTLTAGAALTLRGDVAIAARGTLTLQARPSSARAWKPIATWDRTASSPASVTVTRSPSATASYRLQFSYAGLAAALSASPRVTVRPRISLDRTRFRLRVGDVYRLSGRITPAHPGGRVWLFTDRGGRWHRVSLGGTIRLREGTRFATRRFGTPIAERYRLQVRVPADRGHLAARSATVLVVVGR